MHIGPGLFTTNKLKPPAVVPDPKLSIISPCLTSLIARYALIGGLYTHRGFTATASSYTIFKAFSAEYKDEGGRDGASSPSNPIRLYFPGLGAVHIPLSAPKTLAALGLPYQSESFCSKENVPSAREDKY